MESSKNTDTTPGTISTGPTKTVCHPDLNSDSKIWVFRTFIFVIRRSLALVAIYLMPIHRFPPSVRHARIYLYRMGDIHIGDASDPIGRNKFLPISLHPRASSSRSFCFVLRLNAASSHLHHKLHSMIVYHSARLNCSSSIGTNFTEPKRPDTGRVYSGGRATRSALSPRSHSIVIKLSMYESLSVDGYHLLFLTFSVAWVVQIFT